MILPDCVHITLINQQQKKILKMKFNCYSNFNLTQIIRPCTLFFFKFNLNASDKAPQNELRKKKSNNNNNNA